MNIRVLFTLFWSIFLSGIVVGQQKPNTLPTATQTLDLNRKVHKPFSVTHNNVSNSNVSYQGLGNNSLNLEPDGLRIVQKSKDNSSFLIKGTIQYSNRNNSLESKCSEYLKASVALIAPDENEIEYVKISEFQDELGFKNIKYQQQYDGINVYGGEIILHLKNDRIEMANGKIISTIKALDTNTSLSENQVLGSMSLPKVTMPNVGIDQDMLAPKIEKTILVTEGFAKVCYHVSAYTNLIDRQEYFIDANNGETLRQYGSLCKFNHDLNTCHAVGHHHKMDTEETVLLDGAVTTNAVDLLGVTRSISTYLSNGKYYMIDASKSMFNAGASSMPNDPKGVIWTLDAFNTSPAYNSFNYDHVVSSNNSWTSSATAVSSQFNASTSYEYYKQTFNRQSISGTGQNIVSFINVADENGQSMDNAFWNGFAMFYGNGSTAFKPLARGLDVAGHEMTHGVIQATANLDYQGESGAINESFADVFGAMIDRDNWLIGEDVVKTSAFPSGALRSLSDPHNGASSGNFNGGWQPRIYSERYTGSQDNGGVHINSGIPNYAFYLFASNNAVGKDKAEKVYYRALTVYLTKSSKFVDLRIAVVQSAQDLYGTTVANVARQAFDSVEVFGDDGGDYEVDIDTNPGENLILLTAENQNNLYVFDADGNAIFNPLSNSDPINKPSVSDNGDEIVFVASDGQIHYIYIDWQTKEVYEDVIDFGTTFNWRNAAISKDGLKMACLLNQTENVIYVVDFNSGHIEAYELSNPTYTNGVTTGDVEFADAMEFDLSGEYLVYDAKNAIVGTTTTFTYWDIGFIKVWDNNANNFAAPNQIEKLFGSLPDNVSVANPTFAKNSPYIIAFDVIIDGLYYVYGMNLENSDQGLIYENLGLSYPNFSKDDQYLIFDSPLGGNYDVGIVQLKSDKINPVSNTESYFFNGARWGIWFSNGSRDLVETGEVVLDENSVELFPNPCHDNVNILSKSEYFDKIEIFNTQGLKIWEKRSNFNPQEKIVVPLRDFNSGCYVIKLSRSGNVIIMKIIKE